MVAIYRLMMFMNKGLIRGTLLSIEAVRGYQRYVITTEAGNGRHSVLGIVVYGPQRFDVLPGNRVDAHCHVEMSRIRNENATSESDQFLFRQIIVGDDIQRTKRELCYELPDMEFANTSGGYPHDKNLFVISGKVRRVYVPNDKTCLVSVSTDRPARRNQQPIATVNLSCFHRQRDTAVKLNAGDTVVFTAAMLNGNDSRKWYNEMLYCRDIAKTEDADTPEDIQDSDGEYADIELVDADEYENGTPESGTEE